ncbi:MAG: hypothetical protein DI570_12580 [Phenylobacterium zucineum]|nr:MAG: hypothetical protein DI570_12580 [Phenylobacterium zucineum]
MPARPLPALFGPGGRRLPEGPALAAPATPAAPAWPQRAAGPATPAGTPSAPLTIERPTGGFHRHRKRIP